MDKKQSPEGVNSSMTPTEGQGCSPRETDTEGHGSRPRRPHGPSHRRRDRPNVTGHGGESLDSSDDEREPTRTDPRPSGTSSPRPSNRRRLPPAWRFSLSATAVRLVARRRRREDRLDLERARRRMGRPDPGGVAGDVRRGEAVAGRDDPAAAPPGDVDVQAVRPELDRRRRVVEPDRRVADVVGGDRDDRREQRRVAGPATLFAAQTSSTPAKYARSASSWKIPNSASLRDERLRLMTPAPCSIAHSRPAANAAPLARLSGPSTRTDTIRRPARGRG